MVSVVGEEAAVTAAVELEAALKQLLPERSVPMPEELLGDNCDTPRKVRRKK